MNREELSRELALKTETTIGAARLQVNTMLDLIGKTLASGEEVRLMDFGTLKVERKGARLVTNPRTRQPMMAPPKATVKFLAAKNLNLAIDPNGKGR